MLFVFHSLQVVRGHASIVPIDQLIHTHTLSLIHSLSHTHTLSLIHSLSHTHTLSLILSHTLSHIRSHILVHTHTQGNVDPFFKFV